MPTSEQLADEARRAQKVRQIVDISTSLITQSGLSRRDAEHLVHAARERILSLFPGEEDTYELLYARRFQRLIDEFTTADPPARGVILPFRPRAR
jgi:hypothetical protein